MLVSTSQIWCLHGIIGTKSHNMLSTEMLSHGMMMMQRNAPKNVTRPLHSLSIKTSATFWVSGIERHMRVHMWRTEWLAAQLYSASRDLPSPLLFHSLCSLHHVTHTTAWFCEIWGLFSEMWLWSASLWGSGQAVLIKPPACSDARMTISVKCLAIINWFLCFESSLQFYTFLPHITWMDVAASRKCPSSFLITCRYHGQNTAL